MRRLFTALAVLALAAGTASLAQEAKPRAYTLVVSGAR